MNKLLPVPVPARDQIAPGQVPLDALADVLERIAATGDFITAGDLLDAGLADDVAVAVLAAVRLLWELTRASHTPRRPTAEQAMAANLAKAKIAALLASDAAQLFVLAARACPVQWAALAHTAGVRQHVDRAAVAAGNAAREHIRMLGWPNA